MRENRGLGCSRLGLGLACCWVSRKAAKAVWWFEEWPAGVVFDDSREDAKVCGLVVAWSVCRLILGLEAW